MRQQGVANTKDSVLALAAAAEAASEHPVGRAVAEASRARGVSRLEPAVEGFQATPGMGVSCVIATDGGGKWSAIFGVETVGVTFWGGTDDGVFPMSRNSATGLLSCEKARVGLPLPFVVRQHVVAMRAGEKMVGLLLTHVGLVRSELSAPLALRLA